MNAVQSIILMRNASVVTQHFSIVGNALNRSAGNVNKIISYYKENVWNFAQKILLKWMENVFYLQRLFIFRLKILKYLKNLNKK